MRFTVDDIAAIIWVIDLLWYLVVGKSFLCSQLIEIPHEVSP
jgi:hypothetical protein